MEKIVSLMDDPAFVALRRDADEGVVLYSDLTSRPLPVGLDVATTWRALTAVRHQTASELPWTSYITDGESVPIWYSMSRAMYRSVGRVESLCGRGSKLERSIRHTRSSTAVAAGTEEDLAAALARDGAIATREDVHRAKLNGASDKEPLERLVSNFFDVLSDMKDYLERPIGPGMIEDIHYRLTKDVGNWRHAPLPGAYVVSDESPYHDPLRCLAVVSAMADRSETGDLHPLYRILCIYWLMNDFRPLASWNAVTELAVRQILLERWNLGVLRYVALSHSAIFDHVVVNERDRSFEEVFENCQIDCGYGLDVSMWFTIWSESVLQQLDELEQTVAKVLDLNHRLEEVLSSAGSLNYRQRAILANAIQDPTGRQFIEPHRRQFGVAYATARQDFLTLCKLGYMAKGKTGNSFYFTVNTEIANRLERALGD